MTNTGTRAIKGEECHSEICITGVQHGFHHTQKIRNFVEKVDASNTRHGSLASTF